MSILRYALVLGLLLGGLLPSKAAEGEKKAPTTDSKAKEALSPLTVNFPAAFGLDFASLKNLGVCIARAEEARDPVGLILAAKELQVAEQVSGKEAAIKSADLLKESVEMAKRRHRPKELQAVALLVGDEKVSQELRHLANRVTGTKSRGINGFLVVHNGHKDTIHVYINDGMVGHVFPGGSRSFRVEDDPINDTTKIYAHDPAHPWRWGPHFIVTPNSGTNHIWNIR